MVLSAADYDTFTRGITHCNQQNTNVRETYATQPSFTCKVIRQLTKAHMWLTEHIIFSPTSHLPFKTHIDRVSLHSSMHKRNQAMIHNYIIKTYQLSEYEHNCWTRSLCDTMLYKSTILFLLFKSFVTQEGYIVWSTKLWYAVYVYVILRTSSYDNLSFRLYKLPHHIQLANILPNSMGLCSRHSVFKLSG